MTITIRNEDEKLYKIFTTEAKRREQTVGEALNEAMRRYLIGRKREARLDLLPSWDWGEGNENSSKEVDKILAGDK